MNYAKRNEVCFLCFLWKSGSVFYLLIFFCTSGASITQREMFVSSSLRQSGSVLYLQIFFCTSGTSITRGERMFVFCFLWQSRSVLNLEFSCVDYDHPQQESCLPCCDVVLPFCLFPWMNFLCLSALQVAMEFSIVFDVPTPLVY